jgi:hypothetical protein
MVVQQRQHADAVGHRTFLSGLIDMSVFDILQISSGCTAHTCNPLTMDLITVYVAMYVAITSFLSTLTITAEFF